MSPLISASPLRRPSASAILRWGFYAFLLAGITALAYTGCVLVEMRTYQSVQARPFDRVDPRADFRVAPTEVTEGSVIGRIEIPRLGFTSVVAQGDSDDVLRRAVGHVSETALPGQAGNVAMAGHRDTIFRPLRNIRVGDVIKIETFAGNYTYQVDSTEVVPPTDVAVLQSHGENELTLITCFPFHFIGHAPNRFIVRAREIAASQR